MSHHVPRQVAAALRLDSLRITQIVPSPVQCLPQHRGDPPHNPTKKFLYSFFHLLHIFSVMAFFEF